MLVIALFLMRVRRMIRRMIRPLALFGVVVVVIAIGFIHRRRRQKRVESGAPSAARPIDGTSTVGVVGDAPAYQTTTVHLRPDDTP